MRRGVVGASVAALAPASVLVTRAARGSWLATDDYSLIELQTRAVGTRNTPLVGPYSRFGWNHPGPALFFALAAPYRIAAAQSRGLLVGGALIAGAALVTVVVASLGRDRPLLVGCFGILVAAVLLRALGAAFLWDFWNPNVIVLPFLALVLLCWRIGAGEPRALPFAVGVASFVTQTHVALAGEAAVLLLVAFGWLAATTRGPEARAAVRRSLAWAAGVLAIMWALPIYQQFRPRGGNLGDLWRFWTTSHPGTVGFAQATHLLAHQLSIPAPWITGREPVLVFSGGVDPRGLPFPYALVVLAVAALVAWRRRDRAAMVACAVALTVTAVAWISIAKIVGVPFPYLIRWAWVVGATCWIASGIALLPALAARLGVRGERALSVALGAGAAALLVVVSAGAWSANAPNDKQTRAARSLVEQATPSLRKLPQPILFVPAEGGYHVAAIVGGVITGAVEHGIDARYTAADRYRAGPERVVDPKVAAATALVAVGADVATYAANPAYRMLATYDTLTPSERAEDTRLNRDLAHAEATLDARQITHYIETHTEQIGRLSLLAKRDLAAAIFVRLTR
jgi:hypothetical protein